jgi:hypothetical protein
LASEGATAIAPIELEVNLPSEMLRQLMPASSVRQSPPPV